MLSTRQRCYASTKRRAFMEMVRSVNHSLLDILAIVGCCNRR